MVTFFRLSLLLPSLATIAAMVHDAAAGNLSPGGATGAALVLCACAALWRGLDVAEVA